MSESYGENTRSIHTPAFAPPAQRPEGLPVYRTAAFAFDSAEEYAKVLGGEWPGYSYSRVDNPTADAFAAGVAALEGYGVDGEVTGQPFASGMAAISTALMAFLGAGDHVVAPREVYGGTYSLLHHVLSRYGVETTFVDAADVAAVAAAVRPDTKVVYAETLANPTMSVSDLPAVAQVAHDAGAVCVVDSTFATPVVCRPLQWGVDLVVHSATKYLGGQGDVTGGVVVGRPELIAPVRQMRIELGGALAPDEAFLLHRGLATLPLRVERHCETALALATALADHPAVARVYYPGLPSHPQHALATRLFDVGRSGTRYGAVVTIAPHGGREAGMKLCDALELTRVATSLGGVHSKVSHVASTTHRQMDDEALLAADIDPGAVRISVGLEDAEDVIADVIQALERI